jgi:tetratricopeptide (TPR) repeat protein
LAGLTDSRVASRPQLWRWGIDLIADYPFTGSGLGSTMMVLSSYALMLHVGFIHHVHNLYLQVAVEQGLPGLLAFGALIALGGGRLWRAQRAHAAAPLTIAAAAAFAALLIHGIVDAGLYASRLAPVIFLPIGFALAAGAEDKVEAEAEVGALAARPYLSTLTFALSSTLALTLALTLLPAARAAFQANLGALAQTRAELSVYRWPVYPIQDALRRQAPGSPPPVNLGPAIARYRAALALDPDNAAANRRLGQIELSQGDYIAAQTRLEAAYHAAPDQRATRQLLGESYAIAGRTAEAAALWATVGGMDWQDRTGRQAFDLRAWWYGAVGETANQQRIAQAIRQLTTDH